MTPAFSRPAEAMWPFSLAVSGGEEIDIFHQIVTPINKVLLHNYRIRLI